MGKRQAADFRVAVDTREQRPYLYTAADYDGQGRGVATLTTGDYSIVGREADVAVERKTKADAYGSLGGDRRERFEAEARRLGEMFYGAIVIESSLPEFLKPLEHSEMNPVAAVASLVSWSVRYGVPVWFGGDRRHSAALTYNILEKFHRHIAEIKS